MDEDATLGRQRSTRRLQPESFGPRSRPKELDLESLGGYIEDEWRRGFPQAYTCRSCIWYRRTLFVY